ncbi:hypothetical protein ACFLU6_07630 [Acidobacteriota bacterium]
MGKHWLFLLALSFAAVPIAAQEFLINGGFETGDTTGWTHYDDPLGGDTWLVYTGTNTPNSGTQISAPPGGIWAAVLDPNTPGTHILFQDVTIPAGGAAFVVNPYVDNPAGDWEDPGHLLWNMEPNQQYRVDIMDPAAPIDDVGPGVLVNVFRTDPGDSTTLGPWVHRVDLTPFAGATIRVRIAAVHNQGPMYPAVDSMSVMGRMPNNDLCNDAIPVSVPSHTVGTNYGSTPDQPLPACRRPGAAGAGVWYKVMGTGYTMTATLCPDLGAWIGLFDSYMSVYCRGCATPRCVDGNDDGRCIGDPFASTVIWCAEAGVEYHIWVAGNTSGHKGDFILSIFDNNTPCTGGVDCAANLRRNGVDPGQCPLATVPMSPTSKADLFLPELMLADMVTLPYQVTGARQSPPAGPLFNSCLIFFEYDDEARIALTPVPPGPDTEFVIVPH